METIKTKRVPLCVVDSPVFGKTKIVTIYQQFISNIFLFIGLGMQYCDLSCILNHVEMGC